MTYRTISGDNPTGVTVSASYTGAFVEKSATIEGNGLDMLGYGRVENYGLIHAASGDAGVYLTLGGYVFTATGAAVSGSVGVKSLAGGSAALWSTGGFLWRRPVGAVARPALREGCAPLIPP